MTADTKSETVRGTPDDALAAVGRAAEDWGASWRREGSGGRLELPVSAGLRHGRVSARVDVTARAPEEGEARSEVALRPESSEYHLWTPAIVILSVAAAGGLLTVLWPFFPRLLPVAPFGAILGLSAWFLVVTRLQNRGAEEFLALAAGHAGALLDGVDEGPGEGGAGPDRRSGTHESME